MGLRFRKTISILPGVRLNLGKSTQSISVGVPGFRKTFNTKGQVTTTVGLPGTGLYYVDTKNPKKEKERAARAAKQEKPARREQPAAQQAPAPRREGFVPQIQRRSIVGAPAGEIAQLSRESLITIHKAADDAIIWRDVARSADAPDASYNQEMWSYYHSVAKAVLAGDIDTYLRVIYEVNPLDDLLDYGSEFTFGTDDPDRMEVEFVVNADALSGAKVSLLRAEYNVLLQDYVCSTAIRIARDIFALLPVQETLVHARLRDDTILSAAFDRATMDKLRFGFLDPSDTMARFTANMNFSDASGFSPVDRLE